MALATVLTLAPKSVQYSLNNVSRLSYVRDFVVSATAPYSEDFGNILRGRSFYASLTTDAAGVPTVSIIFDADVDPFNTVDFGAQLRVKSRDGENTAFFACNAAQRTRYTLSCAREALSDDVRRLRGGSGWPRDPSLTETARGAHSMCSYIVGVLLLREAPESSVAVRSGTTRRLRSTGAAEVFPVS